MWIVRAKMGNMHERILGGGMCTIFATHRVEGCVGESEQFIQPRRVWETFPENKSRFEAHSGGGQLIVNPFLYLPAHGCWSLEEEYKTTWRPLQKLDEKNH
jgi:hypothetical protein